MQAAGKRPTRAEPVRQAAVPACAGKFRKGVDFQSFSRVGMACRTVYNVAFAIRPQGGLRVP